MISLMNKNIYKHITKPVVVVLVLVIGAGYYLWSHPQKVQLPNTNPQIIDQGIVKDLNILSEAISAAKEVGTSSNQANFYCFGNPKGYPFNCTGYSHQKNRVIDGRGWVKVDLTKQSKIKMNMLPTSPDAANPYQYCADSTGYLIRAHLKESHYANRLTENDNYYVVGDLFESKKVGSGIENFFNTPGCIYGDTATDKIDEIKSLDNNQSNQNKYGASGTKNTMSTPTPNSNPFKIYSNPQYKFSFSYPSSWTLREGIEAGYPDILRIHILNPNYEKDGVPDITFEIASESSGAIELSANYNKNFSVDGIQSFKKSIPSGIQCAIEEVEFKKDGSVYDLSLCYEDEKAWQITKNDPASIKNRPYNLNAQNTFYSIVSSWHFTN